MPILLLLSLFGYMFTVVKTVEPLFKDTPFCV